MERRTIAIVDDGTQAAKAACARLVALGYPAEVASGKAGDRPTIPAEAADYADRELRTTADLALARHAATRAADELEGFFAVSVDMFCFLSYDGYFKRLNAAWERTLGYTVAELMSRPFIEFVHPHDRERTLAQNAAVRAGGAAILFENRYVHKDGSHRWLLWNATPHPDRRVIYSAARDITARKEAETERMRLVEQLTTTLAEVRTLRSILPICSYCRRIRGSQDDWHSVEAYIRAQTGSRFSHGICPDCMEREVEPHLRDVPP